MVANILPLIILVFALVFAILEGWKGAATIKPVNWGWVALGLLIVVELFYHGMGVFK